MVENKNAEMNNCGPGDEKSLDFSISVSSDARISLIAMTTGIERQIVAIILVKIVVPLAVLWIREFAKLI